MAGDVVDEIEPLHIVAKALPIHFIRNRRPAYFFDLLDPAGKRGILQLFDLASFVEAHWPSLSNLLSRLGTDEPRPRGRILSEKIHQQPRHLSRPSRDGCVPSGPRSSRFHTTPSARPFRP